MSILQEILNYANPILLVTCIIIYASQGNIGGLLGWVTALVWYINWRLK